MDITIDARHDPHALGRVLRARRRLQIRNFLAPDCAAELHRRLQANQHWYLAYNEGDQYVESPLSAFQALSAEQRRQFLAAVHRGAATGFQYLFAQYHVSETLQRGDDPGHPLHPMHGFVNGPAWLGFMQTLTGEEVLTHSDCLASLYAPGHFLTDHDDQHDTKHRVAAWVIGLTRDWNRNWGGHLVFFDERGNIEQGFVPEYNTLSVFLVPQPHAVQPVAAWARGYRTSFTGWVHRPGRLGATSAGQRDKGAARG